jgi:drug/metabolite transporter (DMT)-like permease
MKRINLPVQFYGFAAMLFWGMSFIWTSVLLKYYPPVTIIFLRLIISSSFLFLMMMVAGKKERILAKDFGLIFLSAIFNPFLYFLGENTGLKFTSPAVTSVVIATIPVFSPVVAWFTLKERISLLNITGIFICFGGLLVMLITRNFTLSVEPRGLYYLAGAVVSALIYSVLLKRLTFRYRPLTIIAWQNLIGIFLFLPLFLIFDLKDFARVDMNREIVSSLFLLAILASSLSFVFYANTVKALGITKANVFTNLIPVITAILSFTLISEPFTPQKAAGILIVIAGVFVSEFTRGTGKVPRSDFPE